jgi:hypothetical protein
VKYLILIYGSQRAYDAMAGKGTEGFPVFSPEDFAANGAFMDSFIEDLDESGELIAGYGLTAPVTARRIRFQGNVPVVTDGPYAETQEVLAGFWIVDAESLDRATEIASKLVNAPGPQGSSLHLVDIRRIAESQADIGF